MILCSTVALAGGPSKPADSGGSPLNLDQLPKYETRYYIIYTDLERPQVQEAAIRVTKMAEVYHERTKDFSGAIDKKFPFILFRSEEDYQAAGGPPGTAGVYNGLVLMAVAGEKLSSRTWHVVQHEGFHQFAMNVIRGDLPVWVNEGLAEYFGEGIFTGDDMITGVIPNWRLKRIKQEIARNKFKPIDQIMKLTLDQWNQEMDVTNYDQAWSMVQFLAHGDGGKYQKAFSTYMGALGRGKNQPEAWNLAFGDTHGFEARWQEFWKNLPEDSTDDLYRRATVATLTSFLARSVAQGQTFATIEEFAAAASADQLTCAPDELLPRSLLAGAMDDVDKRLKAGDTFALANVPKEKLPQIVMQTHDDQKLVGRFQLNNRRVAKVWVEAAAGAAGNPNPGAQAAPKSR